MRKSDILDSSDLRLPSTQEDNSFLSIPDSGLPLAETIEIPAQTGSYAFGRLDLWLQVRINPNATNANISHFELPEYRITLTANLPDN